jgi:predicted nucleic acid-binding protein
MKVVLDTNVLISVLNMDDANHQSAEELVAKLSNGDYEIYAPVTYLWELDAYVRHPDKASAHRHSRGAEFKITTCDVTNGLYVRTYCTEMAFIKGADRVFVSLARDQGAPLITNDRQLLNNAATLGVRALSVADFLSQMG